MSWTPPERPAWAKLMNAGAIPEMAAVARAPLTIDSLLAEARVSAGIDDGGDADFGPGFREPLTVLLDALDAEADLTLLGRWLTRRHLLRLLRVRHQFVRYLQADPAAVDEPIEAPLVVTGAPRTGTTILHALLAADPALRAPLGWELLLPVPPPVPGDVADVQARVELAELELRSFADADPGLDAIHEYGARNPKECISAMSFAFLSEEFVVRYNVPSYTRWLAECDMRSAYDYHRLVLALLQRRSPRQQWVLKSPVHLHSLKTLLDVYPDARIAVTHRDPLAVLGSVSSLVAHLRWAHSDHVDLPSVGRYHAELYARSLNALADNPDPRLAEPGRLHSGSFAELAADPIGAAKACYASWRLPFSAAAQERMQEYVDARPRGRHGSHEYSFGELGLDAAAERSRFAPYTQHFSVPDEVS
ncbi:MAG TPA: sulfotransferase [Frankiaceae bacterium]|nr:sulfotransferase [Frankiaceae bacterium]